MAVGSDFYPAPYRGEVRPHGRQFRRDGVERACLCRAARSRLLPTTMFSLSTFLNARLVRRLRWFGISIQLSLIVAATESEKRAGNQGNAYNAEVRLFATPSVHSVLMCFAGPSSCIFSPSQHVYRTIVALIMRHDTYPTHPNLNPSLHDVIIHLLPYLRAGISFTPPSHLY